MAANYFLLQTVTKEQTCRKFCNFPGRNFFPGFFAETIFFVCLEIVGIFVFSTNQWQKIAPILQF